MPEVGSAGSLGSGLTAVLTGSTFFAGCGALTPATPRILSSAASMASVERLRAQYNSLLTSFARSLSVSCAVSSSAAAFSRLKMHLAISSGAASRSAVALRIFNDSSLRSRASDCGSAQTHWASAAKTETAMARGRIERMVLLLRKGVVDSCAHAQKSLHRIELKNKIVVPGEMRLLMQIRRQQIPRDQKPALHFFLSSFERAVFVLDAEHVIVAHFVQCRDEARPIDFAQSGQARNLPAHAEARDAALVKLLAVDAHVFGVHVKNARFEFVHRADAVDELPDQMRGVEIQSKICAGDKLEHAPPHVRADRQIIPAGPFVVRKNHRTIFDGD